MSVGSNILYPTDTAAYHTTASGEVQGTTEKSALVDDDLLLAENSEDSYSKISVKMSSVWGYAVDRFQGLSENSSPASGSKFPFMDSADSFAFKWVDVDDLPSGTPADESITNAKLAHITQYIIKGRVTAGTGDVEDLTATQVRSMLNVEDGADVTDEANVTDALDGATLPDIGTPASGDRLLIQDADDSYNLKYVAWSEVGGGGGASQLSDLSDVVSATNTNRFVLVANGTTGYVGRALVEADISDLGSYLTAETNDLTAAVVWDDVPDANITQSSVTQHQGALTITESQISDLGSYISDISGETIQSLSNVVVTAVTDNEILAYDNGSGNWINQTAAEAGLASASHSHATSDITSGTFADARISESSVTQHQAALSITESQISDLGTYVATTGDQSVGGIKTFTSFPVTPSTAPTADYQVANKKYVDDEITGAGGYNDESAQDAVGGILTDSSEIDFTYDDGTPSITAVLITGSIDVLKLDAGVQTSLGLADTSVQPGDNVSDLTNDAGYVTSVDVVSNVAQDRILGRVTAGSGDSEELTAAQVRTLINVEDGADVTDAANVTAAGALMDSEVTNLAQVKAFDSSDYATAAQGALADSAQQPPTEGAFVDGDKTKLDGIEAGADVTDTANVTAAGALMDSEVDGDIKTLSLPANTTISTFGATLVDDADASAARTTLGLGTLATDSAIDVAIGIACSDETTALTTGSAKVTFRMPYAMTLTDVRASLTGAGSTSGTTTIDINESGTTILSTKLTIDFSEKTSETAATAAVISDSALADDAEITIDIDAVTGGADETGLKVWLIGTKAVS